MLFMYVHTHPVEKCLAGKPEELQQLASRFREGAQAAGIAIRAAYATAPEHTFYIVIEADDYAKIQQALQPMTSWGTARLIPVMAIPQA